jgi:hypothetical protein
VPTILPPRRVNAEPWGTHAVGIDGGESFPLLVPSELRQVDVLVWQGQNMVDAIRQIGVSEVTYYPWRQEFGGLKTE